MNTEYYIISEGERRGPYTAEAMRGIGLRPDTMVWRQGMADWTPASELAELADIFAAAKGAADNYSAAYYYAMSGSRRIGPLDARSLAAEGISADTPVWCQGMADWAPAHTRPDLMDAINARRASEPPEAPGYYNSNARYAAGGSYGVPPRHDINGYPMPHTNWLPWAVAGTVAAFLFSCIGVVFGIIGIVQANKANDAYAMGNDMMGDQANSTARTMTIISLVFAGVGLVGSVFAFIGGLFSGII